MKKLMAVALLVVCGACSEEASTAGVDPTPVLPADPADLSLVGGTWTAPDGGAACVYLASFDGTGYRGSIGRYCSGGERAQWQTTIGSYEVTRPDAELPGRVVTMTVVQSPCFAIGTALTFDALIDGAVMTFGDAAGARALTKVQGTQAVPGAVLPDFGCFAADGSFVREVPVPL